MGDLFIERDAVISDCCRYRYLLRRAWDHNRPRALLVMLNPSTADAEVDDATIRSCRRLLEALGYGSFEVCNLFGFRATDPKNLEHAGRLDLKEIIGERNDTIMQAAINRCDVGVCAWGAHYLAETRGQVVVDMIRRRRPLAYCFGKTKAGAPRHPLYLKTGTVLETYGS